MQAEHSAESVDPKYLLFRLGEELYGTPLLAVKEVIKMTAINPVPYMVSHFRGVINLRGQIVGIADLRLKFQIPTKPETSGLILVIETAQGLLGAVVDDIVSVENILPSSIDAEPCIQTKIPTEFFKGVAKLEKGLVNLIDISGCLSAEELRRVKKEAERASG